MTYSLRILQPNEWQKKLCRIAAPSLKYIPTRDTHYTDMTTPGGTQSLSTAAVPAEHGIGCQQGEAHLSAPPVFLMEGSATTCRKYSQRASPLSPMPPVRCQLSSGLG